MSDFDPAAAVFKSRANKLASLLASGGEPSRVGRPGELAAIFRHQLAAPMAVDLRACDARTALRLRHLGETPGLALNTFGDLFHHPAPVLELLNLVKDFAKANVDQPESGLPGEIATALYYTSIAAALVRLDTRITQLPDAALQTGLQQTLAQSWLDDQTRALLTLALAKVSAGRKGGPA
jgi:hypothetical protein